MTANLIANSLASENLAANPFTAFVIRMIAWRVPMAREPKGSFLLSGVI